MKYPHVKARFMHYPELQNIWQWMARSAFTYGLLTALLNHKNALWAYCYP